MFSEPQPTIEAAQALYTYELFAPAAVFDTGAGFVLCTLRDLNDWPPHQRPTARSREASARPM